MVVVGWRDMMEAGLYSAVAPLMLLLLSSVWRYPAVLEEVIKWLILKWTMDDGRRTMSGAVVGLVFGLSEAVLYTMNSWQSGEWGAMLLRLALTVPMHAITGATIAWGIKNRIGWVGLILAMAIHGGFNYQMS